MIGKGCFTVARPWCLGGNRSLPPCAPRQSGLRQRGASAIRRAPANSGAAQARQHRARPPRQLRPSAPAAHPPSSSPEAAAAAAAQQQGKQPAGEAPWLWSSSVAVGLESGVDDAVAEAVRAALAAGWPAGAQPQLAFLFATSSLQRFYPRLVPLLLEKLPSLEHVIGCSVGAPLLASAAYTSHIILGSRLHSLHAAAAGREGRCRAEILQHAYCTLQALPWRRWCRQCRMPAAAFCADSSPKSSGPLLAALRRAMVCWACGTGCQRSGRASRPLH